jgi:hypothetical protein
MTQHEIKSIKDIYRIVTPETTEAFLADFAAWLRIVIAIKQSDPEGTYLDVEKFTWIDDGKNDLRGVHIEVKEDPHATPHQDHTPAQ